MKSDQAILDFISQRKDLTIMFMNGHWGILSSIKPELGGWYDGYTLRAALSDFIEHHDHPTPAQLEAVVG